MDLGVSSAKSGVAERMAAPVKKSKNGKITVAGRQNDVMCRASLLSARICPQKEMRVWKIDAGSFWFIMKTAQVDEKRKHTK